MLDPRGLGRYLPALINGNARFMAVRIRLARAGAKKRPFYRIVAADARAPRDGRFLERLGTYDPTRSPAVVTLKEDRVAYWLGVGALPTETVRRLMRPRKAAS